MTGLRSARSAGVRGASPPAQTLQLRPLPVSCQPCTSAPNSQRRQFLRPLSCAHWKRGLPRQVPAFAGPSPRLAGLSSITQAGPCGHHVSLRRRRSSRVPEQPPPMAPRMGRVFLPGPGPRPGGRGPRASCVAAQTRRRVGGAHAAAAGGAGHGGAGCGAANAGPHPRIQTHSLSRPGRRSSRAAPPRSPAPQVRAAPAELQPARPAATACTQPGVPWPPRRGSCRPRPRTRRPHLPAPAQAPASAVPFPPRAAAFGLLSDSSRLHALLDFKNKQAPPPPRGARRASTRRRLSRQGSLLARPGRDARAVTSLWRRRSLGAPRAGGVRLAIALPPFLSPPVLRCSVRIALL